MRRETRRLLNSSFLILNSSFAALAAPARTASAPAPLAHLRLDEGAGAVAKDSSGNGLDAKLVDCEWEEFGQQGGCVRLNGASSYIEFPKDPRLMNLRDDVTYSLWMKLEEKGRVSTFSRGGWMDGWTCYLNSGHIAMNGRLADNAGVASACCLRGIPAGTDALQPFVHFALTYRRDRANPSRVTVVFHLNGQQTSGRQGETEYVQKARLADRIVHPLTVGKYTAYESQWFAGLVDEIKVFDHALTSEEIAADYAADKVRRSVATVTAAELKHVDLKPLRRTRLAIVDIDRKDGTWRTAPPRPAAWFADAARACGCTAAILNDAQATDPSVLNAKAFDTVILPTVAMPFVCEDTLFRFLADGGTLIVRSVIPWTYRPGSAAFKEHSYGWYAPFLVRENPTPFALRTLRDPLALDAAAGAAVGDLLPAVIASDPKFTYRPLDRWQKVRTFDGGYGDTANYALAADCTFSPYREPNGIGTDFAFHRYYNARLFGSTLVQLGRVGARLLQGERGAEAFKAILHLAETRFPNEHEERYGRAAVDVRREWSEFGFAYMDAVSALREAAVRSYDAGRPWQAFAKALDAAAVRFARLEGLLRRQRKMLLADKDAAATQRATDELLGEIRATADDFRRVTERARAVSPAAPVPARKAVRHRYGTIPSVASSVMPVSLARVRGPLFDTVRRIGSNVSSTPLLDWYAGDEIVRGKMRGLWKDFKFVYGACPVFSLGGDRLSPARAEVVPAKDRTYDLAAIDRQVRGSFATFGWMGTNRFFRIGTGDETGLGTAFWGKSALDYFRAGLVAEYGTVEKMNAACGTDLASFDALALPVRQPQTQAEHALWELWRCCRERKLREHNRAFYRVVKAASPAVDTFNIPSCGAFASPLNGVNVYETFADTDMSGVDGTCVLDEYEWQYADLCPQKRFLTSEWGGLYQETSLQWLYGKLWQEMSAGSWGAEQHIWSFGEDTCNYADCLDLPTKNGAMLWAWLRDARRYDPLFLDGARAAPEVAILYSQTSRCHDQGWGFEGAKRTSAHLKAVSDLYRIFLDWGRSCRVVDEAEPFATNTPVLIVAEARYLDAGVQKRLRDYAAQGGHLIVIGKSGEFDRFGRPCGLLGNPVLGAVTPTGVEGALRARGLSERFAVSDPSRMFREWVYDGETYLVLASRAGTAGRDWGLGEVELAVRGEVELEDWLSGLRLKARRENGYTVFRTLAVNGARVFKVVSGAIAPADDAAARARPAKFGADGATKAAGDVKDATLPFDGKLYDATAIRCGAATFSLVTVGNGDRPDSGESYLTLEENGGSVRQKLEAGRAYELKTPKGRAFVVRCRRNFQMFPFFTEIKIEEKKK